MQKKQDPKKNLSNITIFHTHTFQKYGLYFKFIILGLTALCIQFTYAQETDCTNLIQLTDTLTNNIEKEKGINGEKQKSTLGLVETFCRSIEKPNISCGETSNKKNIYNYQESLFVYFLCQSVSTPKTFSENFSTKKYLKVDQISSLNLMKKDDYNTYCKPKNSVMNQCPIWNLYPKVMTVILNDYFDIKQAQFLFSQDESISIKDQANNFSNNFFNEKLKICESKYYPKTCKTLKEYIKSSRKMTKKTKIINTKEINKTSANCEQVNSKNMIYCALGYNTKSDRHFVNTIYNELFWYYLFMDYVMIHFENTPSNYLTREQKKRPKIDQIHLTNEKITDYKKQSYKLIQGVHISIQKLEEIKSSLPFHIGFLMYQEDVANLRKVTGNMYAPIRTLHDKLRNVQDAKS